MTSQSLVLTEHRSASGVALSAAERDFLLGLGADLTVQSDLSKPDTYVVSAGSVVGTASLGEFSVQIRPKFGISRLMFLISYAIDPRRWTDAVAPVGADSDVLDAVVPGFLFHVGRALRSGLLQGYLTREEAQSTIRGRVLFEAGLQKRRGFPLPLDVRYDDFTEDIIENRLLKAAARRLRALSRVEVMQPALRRVEYSLGNVTDVAYQTSSVPNVHWTRLNSHYAPAVALAQLILRGTSIELRSFDVTASAFFVDMNVVFEEFVRTAIREVLGLSSAAFPRGAQVRGLWLDAEHAVSLEPDLSLWETGVCRLVGDVKYKRATNTGGQSADVFQALAYSIGAGLATSWLVYGDGPFAWMSHHIDKAGRTVEVVTLDLEQAPTDILAQVRDLCTNMTGTSFVYGRNHVG